MCSAVSVSLRIQKMNWFATNSLPRAMNQPNRTMNLDQVPEPLL
jgi:hypothetical protein